MPYPFLLFVQVSKSLNVVNMLAWYDAYRGEISLLIVHLSSLHVVYGELRSCSSVVHCPLSELSHELIGFYSFRNPIPPFCSHCSIGTIANTVS